MISSVVLLRVVLALGQSMAVSYWSHRGATPVSGSRTQAKSFIRTQGTEGGQEAGFFTNLSRKDSKPDRKGPIESGTVWIPARICSHQLFCSKKSLLPSALPLGKEVRKSIAELTARIDVCS